MAGCRQDMINEGNAIIPRSCPTCGIGVCIKGQMNNKKNFDALSANELAAAANNLVMDSYKRGWNDAIEAAADVVRDRMKL